MEDKKDQQNGSNQVTDSGTGSTAKSLRLALRNKELRLECRPWWPLYYKARRARIEFERADAAFWAFIGRPEEAERRKDAAVWAAYRGAKADFGGSARTQNRTQNPPEPDGFGGSARTQNSAELQCFQQEFAKTRNSLSTQNSERSLAKAVGA